jgi:uncharacterized membrane protein YphA (DoxX/SURF4 family)
MRLARRILANGGVASGARWLLGLVFITSALGKIANPAQFADDVAAYRLLPLYMVNLFAITLPWVELLCGLSLINGFALRSGALLVGLLNIMFITASATAMARGLDIECGCLTVARSKVGWGLIARGLVFLTLALLVLLRADQDTVQGSRLGKRPTLKLKP